MEKRLEDILPIMGVEKDCILSKKGDVTIAYKVELPEIFTLSNQDYEALHNTWIRALKVLPNNTIFCKQDWFLDSKYAPDFTKTDKSFIAMGSERFFFERPFLDHSCYIFLTKKPEGRKKSIELTFLQPDPSDNSTGTNAECRPFAGFSGCLRSVQKHHGRKWICFAAKD